jgi:hypothetical protein
MKTISLTVDDDEYSNILTTAKTKLSLTPSQFVRFCTFQQLDRYKPHRPKTDPKDKDDETTR